MFIPELLALLLSFLPAFPPPVEDVRMFPPRDHVAEMLRLHKQHQGWVKLQIRMAPDEAARGRLYEYLNACEEAEFAWDVLRCAWVAFDDPDGPPFPGIGGAINVSGTVLCGHKAARFLLDRLRDVLGGVAYYGGSLPPLPTWPRAEPEPVQLKFAPAGD